MELNKYIDHTNLKADATIRDIEKLCDEAVKYKFASVCVSPYYVPLAHELLEDSNVNVCTVIGFPLGQNTTSTKAYEAIEAINNGAVQAYGVTVTMMNSDYITLTDTTILGYLKIIVYLVAGSMLLMWLGDQITTKGIGNGISMIIFAGIVSALPNQIYGAFANYLSQNLLTGNPSLILEGVIKLLLYLLSFFLIVVFVTYTEKSVRKLPVSHSATGQSGNENAQSSFLPIKINSSGVIPVIFASSIMMAPSIIVSFVSGGNTVPNWAQTMINVFNYQSMVDMGTWSFPWGLIIYLFLIIVFTFFYSNLQINPERLAKDFHDNGTYITGFREAISRRNRGPEKHKSFRFPG